MVRLHWSRLSVGKDGQRPDGVGLLPRDDHAAGHVHEAVRLPPLRRARQLDRRNVPQCRHFTHQHRRRRGQLPSRVHCKKCPYIYGYFVASFPHCTVGPGFIIPSIYGYRRRLYAEPVPLKCGKLATKYPWIYGYFFTVYNDSVLMFITHAGVAFVTLSVCECPHSKKRLELSTPNLIDVGYSA